jgi:hypothetical protein
MRSQDELIVRSLKSAGTRAQKLESSRCLPAWARLSTKSLVCGVDPSGKRISFRLRTVTVNGRNTEDVAGCHAESSVR